MPDKNYSVEDILREIRQQQGEETSRRQRAAKTPPAEPEETEPPRRSRPRRERAPEPVEELTDMGEEYFPPVKLELPKEPLITPPSLDELWSEAETAPARRERTEAPKDPERPRRPAPAPRERSRSAAPARPMWEEDEEPPRSAGVRQDPKQPSQRPAAGQRPSRALWEDEEPAAPAAKPQQTRRPQQPLWEDEKPAAPAPKAQQPVRKPQSPLWEDQGASAARTPAPARNPSGYTRDTAAAARLITGMGEEESGSFEDRVVRKAVRDAGGEGSQEPRRRRATPSEDEEQEKPRRRAPRQEEDPEGEAPRSRRRAALPPEDEGEEKPRRAPRKSREAPEEDRPERGENRTRIAAQLRGMKIGLILRLIVNLLCAAGVVYLMLAPDRDLPIPDYFLQNPTHYLWLEVGLVAFSALVAGNTVGGGMISLFCLRPNNDSYSAIVVFACLVQGSYMAMRPEMMAGYSANLYLPMAALLLLFNTIGKLILRGRIAASYRLIAKEGAKHTAAVLEDTALADKLGKDILDDEPEIAYITRAAGISAFLDQAFSESKAEDISKIIAPMTAAAALVMSLISYLFHHDVFISACVFTAALCITAPIAGVIAANLPITLTNRRLGKWGATLCGYSAVNQFAGVNGLLLRDYDLFPPESVTLHTIRPFNRTPMDEVLADTASVLSQCGSALTRLFLEMVPHPDDLQEAESFVCEDGKGVSAWVNGRRVLIGNRELMKSYGVAIPPREYEEQYGQGKQVLYISNSGQAAGMCVLSYKADKQMRRALELLADRDIAVCVYTTDPNVTKERISQIYNFPKELVQVMPAALHREMDRYLDPKAKAKAVMIHDGTPSSCVRGVAAARSCDGTLTIETALILLSVVVGFALVTFFAFTGGMPALTWVTIAAYQGFWAVIQLLVALITG